jgi:hypothetical protein
MADKQTPAEKLGVPNPHVSADPSIDDEKYADLDPTKVVGRYAMQPDPNDDRPAPRPNVPEGVNEAPKDDDPDAGGIGDGKNDGGKSR